MYNMYNKYVQATHNMSYGAAQICHFTHKMSRHVCLWCQLHTLNFTDISSCASCALFLHLRCLILRVCVCVYIYI